MKNGKLSTLSAGLVVIAATNTALAQEGTDGQYSTGTTTPGVSADAQAQVGTSAQADVGMGLPGAAPATTATTTAAATAPPDQGGNDHDRFVGRFAVGYLGRSSIQIGTTGGTALDAPVIGVRYWMAPEMGLDLGLGFGLQGGSSEEAGEETDSPTFWGLVLHGGVPLALASGRHYVFEVIPEANIGFGSGSADQVDFSGFMLDLGARAGAEIHFGFIGIPELSLQASIGAQFALASSSTTTEAGGEESKVSQSSYSFRTSVYNSPWSIFTSNVAAFYYF